MLDLIRQTFESLIAFIHQFTNIVSKGDPVVNGLATMGALSFGLYLCRHLPLTAGKLIFNSITFRYNLTMTRTYGSDKLYFEQLAEAVRKHNTKRRVFSLSFLGSDKGRELVITSGKGSGYFFLGRGIVFFTRSETITKDIVEFSFSFRTLLISQEEFRVFVDVCPDRGKSMMYIPATFASDEPIATTAVDCTVELNINPKIKKQIDDALQNQVDHKQLFKSRAVCNKLNFLFYGPPGTGKSSLSRYIARKTGRSMLFAGDLFRLQQPVTEVFSARVKPIIVIDDLERNKALDVQAPNIDGIRVDESICSLLNFLDGIRTPDDRIAVITVNDLNKLPPVFYRSNRIDVMIEVDYERKEDFPRCLNYYFPHANPAKYTIPQDLIFSNAICANMFKKHSDDPDQWVGALMVEAAKLQINLEQDAVDPTPTKLKEVA